MKILKGRARAEQLRIAIVGSCFNAPIADRLVQGAMDTFFAYGGQEKFLDVIRVPGAFEIPCAVKKLLEKPRYHAIVACGVLIQGETSHYDHIADQVSARISQLSVEHGVPVTFSIITAPSVEKAWERAGIKGGNLGESGMKTAIEMTDLFQQICALHDGSLDTAV